MFFSKLLKSMSISTLIVGFSFAAFAADYNLRLTANSNDQDEDYDGAVVSKIMLKLLLMGQYQLNHLLESACSRVQNVYRVYLMEV